MQASHLVLALSMAVVVGASAQASAQTQTQTRTAAQVRAAAAAKAAAAKAAAPATAPASSVAPVTVQPQTQPQGRVVSSTDATSITSPNYSAKDAQPAPRAISLGGNAALGVQAADSAPIGGLPASQAGGAKHSDIGVTTVF